MELRVLKYFLAVAREENITKAAEFLQFYITQDLSKKEVWGILAPKDSKLAAKEYATPQDLLKLPLLSTRRTIVQPYQDN